ncbi:MAG: hypothetical protein ACRDQ2_13800 [Gaiellales bacterium]
MNDAVVSHHMNPFRSGVSRFNELLAEHLGVPFVPIAAVAEYQRPLLSFKVSELSRKEIETLDAAVDDCEPDLFLHEFCGADFERRLIAASRRVLAGNAAVAERARELHDDVLEMWTPGLIVENGRIVPAEVLVFTFGMAHKIRTDMFRRLRELLDASGRSYGIRVSAANHETATLRDAEAVFEEMHEIFPDRMYFLGNLSDLAILHELGEATFFAAFFEGGVRANNTSVASAMERGSIVVTNLDAHSPPELRHMENVIDINQTEQLPFDPLVLRRVSVNAMETGKRRSWDMLVERLRD